VDLRHIVAERGWQVAAEHHEAVATIGAKSDRRPSLAALLRGVEAGAYDAVIVHSINLIGRSLPELVGFLSTLKVANFRLIAHTHGIDTAEPAGAPGLLDVGVLLAGYLRFQRRERVLAGQERARQHGVRIGRPPVPQNRRRKVREALDGGAGIREAARLSGTSPQTVLRVRDEMRGTTAPNNSALR
jgi:DNA invertase Pin-like site-specific DNA recombinase